jgi:hypothetical protein
VTIGANNIGQILQAKGDLDGALRYTQRALAIDEKVYGPEHPTVAIRANNSAQEHAPARTNVVNPRLGRCTVSVREALDGLKIRWGNRVRNLRCSRPGNVWAGCIEKTETVSVFSAFNGQYSGLFGTPFGIDRTQQAS